MMKILEVKSSSNTAKVAKATDYQMKFVTQAIGVHCICYLAQFVSLWKGSDALLAIGYSALVTAVLGPIVCIIMPNMRKGGAPVAPMIPFTALYFFMAYRLGALDSILS